MLSKGRNEWRMVDFLEIDYFRGVLWMWFMIVLFRIFVVSFFNLILEWKRGFLFFNDWFFLVWKGEFGVGYGGKKIEVGEKMIEGEFSGIC